LARTNKNDTYPGNRVKPTAINATEIKQTNQKPKPMKKIVTVLCMALFSLNVMAQLKVTTKTFDLESIKKHQGWQLYAGYGQNDQLVLKLGKASCDMEVKNDLVTAHGLAWDFEELYFDKDLNYLHATSKKFDNTVEAMKYEPVWGKTYQATAISLTAGVTLTNLEPADLGELFVVPVANLTGLNKIGRIRVVSKSNAVLNSKGTAAVGCNQIPALKEEGTQPFKQQKGQKWMHIKSFPGKKSCVSLLQVAGDGFPDNKMNYVLQRFNSGLEAEKTLQLSFDYNNSLQIAEVKKLNGQTDYVLISLSCNKFGPKGSKDKPANYAEVIYVDGNQLSISMQETIELPYTRWWMRETVVLNNGDVLLFGPAGKDNKSYIEMPGAALQFADTKIYKNIINNGKESPNLISIKISNNKVAKINAITPKDAQVKTQLISGNDKKSKGVVVFNYPSTAENAQFASVIRKYNRQIYQQNGYILFAYQALPDASAKGPVYGDMTLLLFNQDGALEKCFLSPENTYANNDECFSSDGKKLYWLIHDYESLNKMVVPSVYEGKKIPSMVASIPYLSVIDLESLTASNAQAIQSKEWGIDARNPIVANTHNELVLQGRSAAKKVKQSDLVLIKIEK
jgi:hypothetical protein